LTEPRAAHLQVSDVAASIDWFRHTLGFTLDACAGELPYSANIRRDATRISLRCMSGLAVNDEGRERQEQRAASIEVDHLDTLRELYERARITGAFISRKIEAKPWGAWVFVMRDLDGNLLLISAPQTSA
jgi:uncharacterized glyoxalase superfamily protein PhnB